MESELTCIACPFGCRMHAITDGIQLLDISGNRCARGRRYAETELFHPVRTVTGTIRIRGARWPVLPVKTRTAIPKDRVLEVMLALNTACVDAPVKEGDTVAVNVAGTDIIATRPMDRFVNRDGGDPA